MESAWEKPSTFDADDAVGEPTMSRKSDAQHADMENLRKLGIIRGKPKVWLEKGFVNLSL